MDAFSMAYSMLTTSYNKIRTICERYNVSMEPDEISARPVGFTFQRDAFPTPDLEDVTTYGVIADTNVRILNGLSNIREEPGGYEQGLSMARSLLHTADLPLPPHEEQEEFKDCADPAKEELADLYESVRTSTNEKILLQNPDFLESLQKSLGPLEDVEMHITSNPGLFSNYINSKSGDAVDTVHVGSPHRAIAEQLPGARLHTPARTPLESM